MDLLKKRIKTMLTRRFDLATCDIALPSDTTRATTKERLIEGNEGLCLTNLS